MSTLVHLRLDVRKVQDYIFQVPKLKFMLGANSKIGELFGKKLPDLMAGYPSVFDQALLAKISDERIRDFFAHNVLSSSGGHFEALFSTMDELNLFVTQCKKIIDQDLPGLEYSISWREFDSEKSFQIYMKDPVTTDSGSVSDPTWFDLPYLELCSWDGVSCAAFVEKDPDENIEKLGYKAHSMIEQADRFYNLDTKDSIASLYRDLEVSGKNLANSLEDLAKCGSSLKRNMIAFIKIDGNGTGDRFRKVRKDVEEYKVLEAFISIESFWAENRNRIRKSLLDTLSSEGVTSHKKDTLPYLLMMLGGDDLFLVCIPETAMFIATSLAEKMGDEYPISAGIAYVKYSYPIALANHLAESCLESAKTGSYRESNKPAYIDWHVHFDSVSHDIKDIRRTAYMLHYQDGESEVTELLSARPYSLPETNALLEAVQNMASKLDSPDEEAANNKIKGYRSVLKNGIAEVDYYNEMLLNDEKGKQLKRFFGQHKLIYNELNKKKVYLNSSLDRIELLEFYRKRDMEGGK